MSPHLAGKQTPLIGWSTVPFTTRPPPRFCHAPADDDPGRSLAYSTLYADASVTEPVRLSADSVSNLLYHSMALSACKAAGGSRWYLRVNPSSGNLHPTELYLLGALDPTTTPAVHHYVSEGHYLEQRGRLTADQWEELCAALGLRPESDLLVGFSSILWRESCERTLCPSRIMPDRIMPA